MLFGVTNSTQLSVRRPTGAGISLQGLAKTFRTPQGPVQAVRGVDIEIAPGETVALLGPNGAGKSTTVDMLLGLLPPDTGTVSIFGMTAAESVRSGAIGAMLQAGAIIRDLTVRELMVMMASLYPNPLPPDEVMETTGITPFAGQLTHKLSGGQMQRVRFAIALVSDPDLLVLDEPTVAMDVEGRHAFWASMREFTNRGKTVIFATHYLEEADDNADRIILMAHGRVVADGAPTEIKAKVGLRTIRAAVTGADRSSLERLPGVTSAERRGEAFVLNCGDSDAAIRALLATYDDVYDIEITGAGLEEAFITLTSGDDSDTSDSNTGSTEESAR